MKLNKVYKLSFRRVQKCAELKSSCFWLLFSSFFLLWSPWNLVSWVLSCTVFVRYNIWTESLSMNIGDFFLKYCFCSVSQNHVCLFFIIVRFLQILEARASWWWVLTDTNMGKVILKSCQVETGILLVLRLLSRGRINIGPHFSGKTKLLIVSPNRRAGWVSPFSVPLSATPAPSWAMGTIGRTQPTWRALSSLVFSAKEWQLSEPACDGLSVGRRRALSRSIYIGALGRGLLCRVTYSDRTGWGLFRLDSLAVDGVSLELNQLLFLSFNRLVNRSHLPHFFFLSLFLCRGGGWGFWAFEICKTSKQANKQTVLRWTTCKMKGAS